MPALSRAHAPAVDASTDAAPRHHRPRRPVRCAPRPPLRSLALALALALVSSSLVQAQTAAAALPIAQPAQPLGTALTQLATRANLVIGVDAALVQGKQAPALQGTYTPADALRRLLAGSGLEAEPLGDGFVLRSSGAPSAPADAGAMLPTVRVTGSRNGSTEGTGSYTANATRGATRLNLSPRETPQSVSVITRERMDEQGMTQLSDVFQQTTGLYFNQSGGQGTDSNEVYARGFAVENYQIDGIPHQSSWLAQTGDLSVYDRVEVVRGATGLLNGVGSPAAMINLIRKRPARAFQGSASVSLGSWRWRRAEADVSAPLTQDSRVRGRVFVAAQENDSFIERYEQSKRVLYGIVEADLTPATRLSAGFEYQQHDAEDTARAGLPLFFSDGTLTNFARSRNAATSWSSSHQTQKQAFATLDHAFDNRWSLRGHVNVARRAYDDVVGYAIRGNPDRTTGAGVGVWANQWSAAPTQKAFDLYLNGPFQLLGRTHELVVGYGLSRTEETAPGYLGWPALSGIPDIFEWDGATPARPVLAGTGDFHRVQRQSGAYTTVRLKPTDALSVIAGLRSSSWKEEQSSQPRVREDNGVVTPFLGLVHDVFAEWSVYASYTDVFKVQNQKDIANNYLDPQVGKSFELGTKASFDDDRLNLSVAVFKAELDNVAVDTGAVIPNGGGGTAFEAAKGTTARGFEAEVAGRLSPAWELAAGFAHTRAKDARGERLNTQVPKNQFNLSTGYTLASVGRGLRLGGTLRWQSEIHQDSTVGTIPVRFTQKAFAVLNLMARYPITEQATATLHLNNAFDKHYYTNTFSSYYGTPRELRASLHYRF